MAKGAPQQAVRIISTRRLREADGKANSPRNILWL